jgi:hypothetical protein
MHGLVGQFDSPVVEIEMASPLSDGSSPRVGRIARGVSARSALAPSACAHVDWT